MTTSPSTVRVSTRRMAFVSLVSPNKRVPAPSTTGKIFNRSSSTRVVLHKGVREWNGAATWIFPFSSRFSFETSHAALAFEDHRVVPVAMFERRRHDLLGQAV